MSYSKGIMWLDDCRIPFVDNNENTKRSVSGLQKIYGSGEKVHYPMDINNQQDRDKGRFTPNLLVCDDMLNDGSVSKSNSGGISSGNNFGGLTQKYRDRTGVDDKGTNSRYYDLDKWFDKMLDGL